MADYDYEQNAHFGDPLKSDLQVYNPRLGFVRKVYGIVTVQLLFTFLFSVISCVTSLGQFQIENIALAIVLIFMTIPIFIVLVCCGNFARKVPTNYILLFLFTFCEAYAVSTIVAAYQAAGAMKLVLIALGLTVAMTAALTTYACFTKTDFTTCGAFLFCCSMAMFFFVLLVIFSGLPFIAILCSIFGILLYSLYLIYDTQLIMGGKRHQLSLDDYILAAISIYLDIIMLFLEILELLGRLSGNN